MVVSRPKNWLAVNNRGVCGPANVKNNTLQLIQFQVKRPAGKKTFHPAWIVIDIRIPRRARNANTLRSLGTICLDTMGAIPLC
jgi:hypothetical protein